MADELNESSKFAESFDFNKLDLSDSDEESETFDPIPYAFILKDVHRNPLILSPDKLYNARVACPTFHCLLDHTLAVLWCFYSGVAHEKLGTAQLHWAIKFLEGLVDKRNKHTPDVAMAIDQLEDALIQVGASLDEARVLRRKYQNEEPLDFSRDDDDEHKITKDDDYMDFAKDLVEGQGGVKTSEEKTKNTSLEESLLDRSKKRLIENQNESPSIIVNDMLENQKDILKDLLDNTMNQIQQDAIISKTSLGSTLRGATSAETTCTEDAVSVRDNLIKRAMTQLEQIKNLLVSLDDINANPTPEEIAKLKELLYNLRTHASVTKTMQKKFQNFITKWLDKNATEIQRQQCNDWMMGRNPDLAPNVTNIIQENDLRKTPYKKYNRYKVERVAENS